MSEPKPRAIPERGGITMRHAELRSHALRMREHLRVVADQARRAGGPPEHGVSPFVWDVKLYSTSVTVFAAAAVEATLNQYGLLRFGEEQFEQHFRYSGPVKRLRQLVKRALDVDLTEADQLVEAVSRLAERRNQLLHPRAAGSETTGDGVFSAPESAWNAPSTEKDADASIEDMESFFATFPYLDRDATTFLRPLPVPRA